MRKTPLYTSEKIKVSKVHSVLAASWLTFFFKAVLLLWNPTTHWIVLKSLTSVGFIFIDSISLPKELVSILILIL